MGSSEDGVSAVVAVRHPPAGFANRCTEPVSTGLVGTVFLPFSPIAIRLPSAFTDTDDPK